MTKNLSAKGYRTKEEFKKATVIGILTNTTYMGFVRHKGMLYKVGSKTGRMFGSHYFDLIKIENVSIFIFIS